MTGDHCKLKSYSTLVFKRAGVFLAAVLPVLLLVSCPKPVTDDLLIKVQDSFPPKVTISSPADDSYYYSKISITGTITDSALAANDGKGELALISYTVANDTSRRGRINFADNGSFTKDTSFGSGDIIYDKKTGDYTIPFSTIEVDGITNILKQRVTVTITATDKNNNSTTKTVRLLENEGPYINLVEPGTTIYYFSAGSHIIISGTIGNSILEQNNADEIKSIMWRVSNQAWNGSLDLSEGSSDFNGTIYTSTNVALQYSDPFTYTPATREFHTAFDLPFGTFSVIPVEVRATDLNNHTSYATFNMYTNEAGPVMTFTLPSTTTGIYNDGTNFYINANTKPDISLSWTLDSDDTLNTLGYTLPPTQSAFDNNLALTTPAVIPGTSISAGKLRLTIRAVNDQTKESRYYFDVLADNAAPDITIDSFHGDGGSTDYYVKPRDVVTLNFSVTDSGPTDAVSGLPAGLAPVVSIENSGSLTPTSGYSYSYTLPDYVSDFQRDLAFSISGVKDNVGNTSTTFTQNDVAANVRVKYYSGNATLGTVTSTSSGNPGWAKVNDLITLTFTSSRDLIADPTVTIAGHTATVSNPSGNNYVATYTMTGTDAEGDIPYTIDFTDAAGNPGTQKTGTCSITFDKTPPKFNYNSTDGLIGMDSNNFTQASSTTTVYFNFSEEVINFVAGVVNLTAGSIGSLSAGTNSYTATFSAGSSQSTGNIISVDPGSYSDRAGNPGAYGASGSYDIDTIPPGQPNVTGTTPTKNDPVWNWTHTDPSGNGHYRYKLDNSDLTSGATDTTDLTYTGTGLTGSHILYVQERDAAGNWSTSGSKTIDVDTTPPGQPNVTGTTPTKNDPVWNWTHTDPSGNGHYRYKLDNSDLTSGATDTTDLTYTGTGLTGSHILYVQERDAAGNWSTSGSKTIVVDTTPPTILTDSALPSPITSDGETLTIILNFNEDMYTSQNPTIVFSDPSPYSITNDNIASPWTASDTFKAEFTVHGSTGGGNTIINVTVTDGKDSAGNTMVSDTHNNMFSINM